MRNRTRILLALLTVGVIGGVACWALKPREPEYNGKRLSAWLEQMDDAAFEFSSINAPPVQTSPKWLEARDSVRHIGTNGIPTLLWMLERKDSPLMTNLEALAMKHGFISTKYEKNIFIAPLMNYKPAASVHHCADIGFQFLGADASNAVPDLICIYRENISTNSRIFTLESLGYIGSSAREVVPMLMDVITNSDVSAGFEMRCVALHALGSSRADPQIIFPFLTTVLTNASPAAFKTPFTTTEHFYIRAAAAEALGNYGPKATQTVPALVATLDEIKQSDEQFKWLSWEVVNDALMKIDPETARKMLGVKNAEKK
jgi:hypothetical protein